MRKRILIVEDNVALSQIQRAWLERCGYEVSTALDEPMARRLLKAGGIALVFADVRLPQGNGIELLVWMNREHIHIPFVVMTEYAYYPDAVKAIKLGAKDYLVKPVHREHLLELADTFLKHVSAVWCGEKHLFKRISSQAMKSERLAQLVAPSDMSVLILGENGTGKESVARMIHYYSDRRNAPFVAVNCGAIPEELAASLLFGYAKGAFTGADMARAGYFDMAKGGTLFLDEIGTLSYSVQSVLLRVLQENTYMPVGEGKERRADVRIVSATNEDIPRAILERRFREDLYHRLGEFEIVQPSLRECPEDILPLAEFFRKECSSNLKKETEGFTLDAQQTLLSYYWPGNIRELQNKVKRAVLLSESSLIEAEFLNIKIRKSDEIQEIDCDMDTEKKLAIIKALKASGGHRIKAARLLGINPATLYRRMKKYGLSDK